MPDKPLSGQPSPVGSLTTASVQDTLAVFAPRLAFSAGQLAIAFLRSRSDAGDVFVDPYRLRVIGTIDPNMRTDFLTDHDPDTFLECAPDAPGLIRPWSVVDSAGWADVSDFFHAANKRSLEKVIDHFCRYPGDVFALVSQSQSSVLFFTPNSGETPETVSDYLASNIGGSVTLCFELLERTRQNSVFE